LVESGEADSRVTALDEQAGDRGCRSLAKSAKSAVTTGGDQTARSYHRDVGGSQALAQTCRDCRWVTERDGRTNEFLPTVVVEPWFANPHDEDGTTICDRRWCSSKQESRSAP